MDEEIRVLVMSGYFVILNPLLIGFVIGQEFDGTTVPMVAGFAVCGALAVLAALWANPVQPRAPEPE